MKFSRKSQNQPPNQNFKLTTLLLSIILLLTTPITALSFNITTPAITSAPTPILSSTPSTTDGASSTHAQLPATITEAPSLLNGTGVGIDLQQKYWISTYYSCVTIDTQTHCGTHEQVLKGTGPNGEFIQTAAAAGSSRGRGALGLYLMMLVVGWGFL